MSGKNIDENAGKVLAWHSERDSEFENRLAAQLWIENTDYGGLVLQTACPVCTHENAIDAFVYTTTVTYGAGANVDMEYVACDCGQDHNQPPGGKGCGRWGLVKPHSTTQG